MYVCICIHIYIYIYIYIYVSVCVGRGGPKREGGKQSKAKRISFISLSKLYYAIKIIV